MAVITEPGSWNLKWVDEPVAVAVAKKPMNSATKFVLFVIIISVILFFMGILSGIVIKNALTSIPWWAWVILIFILLWRLKKR